MCAAYAGFRHFEALGTHGYALEAHFDALKHVLITREGCVHVPGEGRGGLHRFHYPGGDAFLRIYRRGGAIRHFVRETYLLENRALAEFRIHHFLAQEGFPTPPLLGAAWRPLGPLVRGAIATHALEGRHLLAAFRETSAPPSDDVLAACGAVIRRLHALRVFHADLNATNLFLTPNGVYLLDFDRAVHKKKPLTTALCQNNLARLRRSMRKHGLPETAFRSILTGYETPR